ncbi:MAG: potassium-transporting ATPase subunit KdpB [Candidatus Obscuribacterales bacterium]|nr:potassium-transporting ATPase subunit KdpB [Candidatus Obscuribacterales bacterium]
MQDLDIIPPKKKTKPLFDPLIVKRAGKDAFLKLHPRHLAKNPVMLVVAVGSLVTMILLARNICSGINHSEFIFEIQITLWLWATVFFANFAEAMAEGRGKAQADTLKRGRKEAIALRELAGGKTESVAATELKKNDIVFVKAGEVIPSDGEVIEGVATVNESAITGESAPVIRESGGDRSAVTGGTTVLSDWLRIRITVDPGQTFLDRMISLVEGAARQKTPNEIALDILLAGLTIVFLLAVSTLLPYSIYSVHSAGAGKAPDVFSLISLLVCLIPTTIGGLLSAIGIAGMDRVLQHNVLAMSGKAVEAAGDVDTLLLDKTGTITLGNRQAVEFVPAPGVSIEELADAAQLSSLSDETPEGRSIVVLAKQHGLRERELSTREPEFIPFTAQTRMSGVNINDNEIRKGASEAIFKFVKANNLPVTAEVEKSVTSIAQSGGTPLAVADSKRGVLGVVHLKDVVKGGMKERFLQLRAMGIRTIMITGDNPLTAAAIASEAGVDDFLAEATPEAKMQLIQKEQTGGRLVAMTGDGTNDAPALAAADVGVAMNTGTQAAKEAGNMIDLDSNPTKLIEVVEIGKQLLMTRGALTTFSIANDVAKYFAILPAMFGTLYALAPGQHGPLWQLNIMGLHSPESAILSAVIFNALVIVALIPLALRGIKYRPMSAEALLSRNLLIYGLGGLIVPFPGIWLIDQIVVLMRLAPAT